MDKTNIVQDVATLFRAAGFEVREGASALDPAGQFAVTGSLDAAGILVESVLEYIETVERNGVSYPPVEEQMGLVPQADLIRRAPGPVADTMDHAQLAALGRHVTQKKGEHD